MPDAQLNEANCDMMCVLKKNSSVIESERERERARESEREREREREKRDDQDALFFIRNSKPREMSAIFFIRNSKPRENVYGVITVDAQLGFAFCNQVTGQI